MTYKFEWMEYNASVQMDSLFETSVNRQDTPKSLPLFYLSPCIGVWMFMLLTLAPLNKLRKQKYVFKVCEPK
jgi:hypothetical protein